MTTAKATTVKLAHRMQRLIVLSKELLLPDGGVAPPRIEAVRLADAVESVEEQATQLLQAGEGQLHLGLHTRGPRDPAAFGTLEQVSQQRRLADAGLAAQHQHAAAAGASVLQQPI